MTEEIRIERAPRFGKQVSVEICDNCNHKPCQCDYYDDDEY